MCIRDRVYLAEKGKVGSATSSWSSKLIHGGLRYLENYEFKLVAESLREREVITQIAPSITKPLPFVIPHTKKLRSKLLIRLGLFLYDNLGGKTKIPKSSKVIFAKQYQNILQSKFTEGFRYYDVQVDDKKLVEMNIDNAKKMGAIIAEDTKVINANRIDNYWEITLNNNEKIKSKILINAAGPWINETVNNVLKINAKKSIRLVRGSHIITKKLYEDDKIVRLSYIGDVLRPKGSQLHPERQIKQAGIELYNAPRVSGAIEVISSGIQALAEVNISNLIIDITMPNLTNLILKNSKNPVFDARLHAMLSYRNPKSINRRFKIKI